MEFPGEVQQTGVPAGPVTLGNHHLLTHETANLRWYEQKFNWNSLKKSKSLVFLLDLHLWVPTTFTPAMQLTLGGMHSQISKWNSLGKSSSLVFLLDLHLWVSTTFSPTRQVT
jgi:hypothetical protein